MSGFTSLTSIDSIKLGTQSISAIKKTLNVLEKHKNRDKILKRIEKIKKLKN